MTRTDVMASSRPQTVGNAATGKSATSVVGTLLALCATMLALALVPASALAAGEPTSGYKQTPTTTTTTQKSGTAPSKEESKPSTPASESTPSTSTAPSSEKASALPFTGFDLRLEIGVALLLIAAGVSIVVLQRRQRRVGER